MHTRKQKWLDIVGSEPKNLDELFEGTKRVLQHCLEQNNPNIKLHGLAWDIYYNNRVSNSHSCPLNGVTNWRSESDKPTGYPGFQGRVWVRYSSRPSLFGSDVFKNTMTHTGTGGYGSYNGPWREITSVMYKSKHQCADSIIYPMSWDYKIFLDDWEGLLPMLMLVKLRDTKIDISYNMEWTDPEALQQDKDIISTYKRSLERRVIKI